MLKKRIITALIGLPVFLGGVYAGGVVFLFLVACLVILSLREYNQIMLAMGSKPFYIFGYVSAVLFPAVAFVGNIINILPLSIIIFLSGVLIFLIKGYQNHSLFDLALTLLGSYYIGGFLAYLILIRSNSTEGLAVLLLVLASTWFHDTFAYFVGRYWGRHLLCRQLSPKKTLEGLVGGLGGAFAAVFLCAYFLPLSVFHCITLAVLITLFAHGGDLWESALKRAANLKDAGKLLPGHGGVLDRFDSLLFTAPLVYYYWQWFIID